MTILDDSDPNFSIFQSNLLFGLYFVGCFSVFFLDIGTQLARNRNCPGTWLPGICWGTWISFGFAFVMIFNTILWIDLNYLLYKRKRTGNIVIPKGKGLLEEIVEEITDPLFILIVSVFWWIVQKIREVRCISNSD